MKRSFDRLLRRVAAATLGAALLWGALAPAATVWAEESPVPAAQTEQADAAQADATGEPQAGETETGSGQDLLLLYEHQTGNSETPYVTDTLRDGDTIPFFQQVFGEITLCRGDADHPVPLSETTVQLLLNGSPVPAEAVQFVPLHESYAQYGVQVSADPLGRLLGQASPNFGMELKLTAGGDSLTISIPNEGVQVSVPEYVQSLTIESSGPDLYTASLYLFVSGDVLYGISPNMDWIAANMQLTGDIAAYFTDPRVGDNYDLTFTATDKLAELEARETVTGQLTWAGKLDQQPHSLAVSYTNSGWYAGWYSCLSAGIERWYTELGPNIEDQLMAGQSGSFKLRLYPQNARPNSGGVPLSLQEEYLTKDLPAGMTATLQPDGVTLLVEYTLTGQDVRDTPWTLTANLPGMNSPETLEIRVKPAPAYWLGSFNMDTSLPPYSYRYSSLTSLQIDTLYEYNAVIPLVDGRPAATREELEQSGITVADSADPDLIQAVPRQLNFTDSIGKTSQVWGFCVSALAENAMNESRSLTISRGNETIATLPYSLNGMNNNGYRCTALQSDKLETLQISDQARQGTIYAVKDDSGAALPLTAAPTVTGTAAQNLTVVWKEGLSGFRVDRNANQVPGEATVEVRVGNTVRRIVYTFIRYPASATYYSSGLDGSYRNYTESLQFTGDLAGVSGKNPQAVQTARFVEDGSFDLYLYSQQYIAAQNMANPAEMGRYYSFAAELVDSIQFYTSAPEVLRIEKQITHSDETDGAFPGNGYANPEGNCFGVTLTPGGKSGSCEVYAEIRLKRPSANDPFGCDMSKTPETVTIGHTFTVQSRDAAETYHAAPDTLRQVLDSIPVTSTPVLVLLEGGDYAMDLNISGKNLILRSADPENPARFTGDPDAEGGFIIRVNAPSSSFALEDLVVDGGGKRGGIQQLGDELQGVRVPFTIRRCQIRNCTTGVSGLLMGGLRLENTQVEACSVGVNGALLYYCTLQNNDMALAQEYNLNITQDLTARWTRFMDNTTDLVILTETMGQEAYTVNLPQNYWNGSSTPTLKVLKLSDTSTELEKTVKLYTSPYYMDESLTTLNVDINTTQMENDTLLLPVEKSEIGVGGMTVAADAFANIQQADKPAQFPILGTDSREMARWSFETIQDTTIDTNLNVDTALSDGAQATVDKLPQNEQDKVLQEVNLSHNGQLPGRATLSIKATQLPQGGVDALYLYWVKPDGTIVPAEVVDVQYDAATQCYVITIDHCSEYIITNGKLENVGEGGSPTATPAPSAAPTATPAPTAAPSAAPTATPAPTAAPSAAPTATPAAGGGSQPTATPAPTAAPAASATPTPAATARPRPTATAQPAQSELISAQQVMDAFKDQPEDVTLDVSVQSTVSQKAFELLANRPDAELRLEGDGYAWVFTGGTIQSAELPDGVFAAGVTQGVDDDAAARISQVAAGAPWYGFDTDFSGQLPGPANLEIVVNTTAFVGMRCGLYWLPEEGDAERVATVEVDENGRVSLPLEHCSIYFLVTEEPVEDVVTPPAGEAPTQDAVQTQPQPEAAGGFPLLPVVIGIAVVLAGGLAVLVIRRRHSGS